MILKFGELPVLVSHLRSYEVYVQFPEAPGVEENTPVRLAGYQVGRVIAVEPPRLMPDMVTGKEYHHTIVVLGIENRFSNIPADVRVRLMKRGLGSSYIQMDYDPNAFEKETGTETKFLQDGAMVAGTTGMTSEFFPEESQQNLDRLIVSLNSLINNADKIVGDMSNQNNIKEALANLNEATKQAGETLKELEKLSASGSQAVAAANENIENVSDAFVNTSFELSQAISEIRKMLQNVNQGQGSAGKFIYDASLYENLRDATEELQLAMNELKALMQQSRQTGIPLRLK